jgi:hypothetical protein
MPSPAASVQMRNRAPPSNIARFPKTFHLFLSLDVVHTSVNLSNLPCKTHAAETIHKKL